MSKVRDLGRLGEAVLSNALHAIRSEDNVLVTEVNLYLATADFTAESSIMSAGKSRKAQISVKALHVFADLAPLHNWAHPVRHFFYDRETGELLHSEYDSFPLDDFETKPDAYEPLHVPMVFSEESRPSPEPEMGKRFFLPKVEHWEREPYKNEEREQYAILFSGNSNNRHLNDLEFLYRVLTNQYKYRPENIIVLNFDGTLNYNGGPQPVGNWPGNNTPYLLKGKISGPGNQKAFDNAFETMKKRLRRDDHLLIHTNNHGGQNGTYHQPWLCGYPNFSLVYTASDFGLRIKELPKIESLVVSMEQCYSGAFMGPVINNSKAKETSFASAVPANMSSMGGPTFDPWACDWIAAFHGANPNGTPLSMPVPANPSVRKAFDYSNAVHVPGDLPQYNDQPTGIGTTMHL